ncbi:Hypothetical predicted protein, partial [Pelobates cultripes]
MADELPEHGRELHRPVTGESSMVKGILQRLDKLFEQFWHRIEARKQNSHPQQQGRRQSERSHAGPGSH